MPPTIRSRKTANASNLARANAARQLLGRTPGTEKVVADTMQVEDAPPTVVEPVVVIAAVSRTPVVSVRLRAHSPWSGAITDTSEMFTSIESATVTPLLPPLTLSYVGASAGRGNPATRFAIGAAHALPTGKEKVPAAVKASRAFEDEDKEDDGLGEIHMGITPASQPVIKRVQFSTPRA